MKQEEQNLFEAGTVKGTLITSGRKKSPQGIARKYIFPGSMNLKKELVRLIHGAADRRDKIALKGQLIDFIRSIE